ncbi:MAG: alpha/beta fold hydrolase [Azospirillaceae bacterium]
MGRRTLTLPRLGETMEEGRVSAWTVEIGADFARGDTLLEVETDKTVVEVPALAAGRLLERLAGPGDTVAVGAPIAVVEAEGASESPGESPEAASAPASAPAGNAKGSAPPEAPGPAPAPTPAPAARPTRAAAAPGTVRGKVRASPAARRAAREAGIDLATLAGRGRRGRIMRADVEVARAGAGRPATPAAAGAPTAGALLEPGERVVEVDGLPVHCRAWRKTEAPVRTALLIHGFGADGGAWEALARALARAGWQLLAPDLPGHGATPGEPAHMAPEAMTALLAGLADRLGLEEGEVVGHSLGAVLATGLAAAAPARIARVTLIAPAGLGAKADPDFFDGLLAARTRAGLLHQLRRTTARRIAYSPAVLDATLEMLRANAEGLRGLAGQIAVDGHQQVSIVEDLERLTVPTRLILGAEDAILPWSGFPDVPPRVAIHRVPAAGHVVHWDDPAAVEAILTGGGT